MAGWQLIEQALQHLRLRAAGGLGLGCMIGHQIEQRLAAGQRGIEVGEPPGDCRAAARG